MATLRLAPQALEQIPPERIAALERLPAKKPIKVQKTAAEKAATIAAQQEQARAAKARRRAANMALRATLIERFPLAFNPANPRPLMIGIDREIAARLGIKRYTLGSVLAHWTARGAYQRGLIDGAPRIDLDGNIVGVVSTDHLRSQQPA